MARNWKPAPRKRIKKCFAVLLLISCEKRKEHVGEKQLARHSERDKSIINNHSSLALTSITFLLVSAFTVPAKTTLIALSIIPLFDFWLGFTYNLGPVYSLKLEPTSEAPSEGGPLFRWYNVGIEGMIEDRCDVEVDESILDEVESADRGRDEPVELRLLFDCSGLNESLRESDELYAGGDELRPELEVAAGVFAGL